MEQIAQSKRIQSRLGTSLHRDSPESTLESRIQCPPLQGQAIRSRHPKTAQRDALFATQQRRFRPQAPDRIRSQKSTQIGIRSSRLSPPTSWAGSLLWLLRRAAGNPLAASAALRNQTISASFLRVRDPAATPDWLLGASPLLCRGRNRGARLLCAQWWARSCDRSDEGRLARPMGRGEVVLRGHASGHQ